jgi:nucleotide-binding universal stress UspA family protein
MVPVDLSDRNERALRTALGLARERGGRVTLFHVIQRVSGITRLRRTARKFAERGLDVRTEVRVGDPPAEIIRATLRERVDLVVMGSHKVRRGDRKEGWGTTSYKVGIFCQCPILLVK